MDTGNYGKVREAYVAARQDFPEDFIQYIWQSNIVFKPKILDLGCGTGIATRQLAEHRGAFVVGCDVDQQMIEEAQELHTSNITYITAPANNLPFEPNTFDTVTAFSAFHWFKDKESLNEIRRVLKKGSRFFVVNKNDIRGFRKGYKPKLAKLLNKDLSNPKDDYDPAEILKESGFEDVITKTFLSKEYFSADEALRHIQSAAAWSEVPMEKEQEAINLMKSHIAETVSEGQAIRELEVVVVSGRKLLSSIIARDF